MREWRHRLVGFVTLLVARRIIRRAIRKQTEQVLTRLEIHQRPSRLRRILPVVGAAAALAAAGAAGGGRRPPTGGGIFPPPGGFPFNPGKRAPPGGATHTRPPRH